MSEVLKSRLLALDQKIRDLQQKAAGVDAVIAERRNRASTLGKNVAEAKHRLELNPDVQSFMISLQQRVHQRGVGLYEKLLTALVQDVLPENPHPVSLELSTEKGLPALTIQLGRGDTAQNIFEDTGGSLTNVVSSGLRFIALARSPLRKFLVLDEPDCWIEPFRIPRFADILSDMSDEVGVQAILISHHQDSAFAGLLDRMRLEKDSQGVIKVKHMRKPIWLNDSQVGIRSIRLERFMSHLDTLIELGPGINVLSGPNHIGKSAIVNSLRVFAYHEGADRQIMHGFNDFVITITLENGKVITCKRNRKGARKTVYTYFEPGMLAPREEPASKTEAPEFVVNNLKIQRLNDLDIQLSHQKMPVFLLNEPHTKQATLLSAGLEADHVRKMLEVYKKWNDLDRATVRNDEKELMLLTASLEKWDSNFSGSGVSTSGLKLGQDLKDLNSRLDKSIRLQRNIAAISKYDKLKELSLVRSLPEAPLLRPVAGMFKLHKQWLLADRISRLSIPVLDIKTPTLRPLGTMIQFGRKWQKTNDRYKVLNAVKVEQLKIDPPVLHDYSSIINITNKLKVSEDTFKTASLNLLNAQKELEAVNTEIKEICGGVCVLCEQPMPHAHK